MYTIKEKKLKKRESRKYLNLIQKRIFFWEDCRKIIGSDHFNTRLMSSSNKNDRIRAINKLLYESSKHERIEQLNSVEDDDLPALKSKCDNFLKMAMQSTTDLEQRIEKGENVSIECDEESTNYVELDIGLLPTDVINMLVENGDL
ncbi:hypothetical protein GJ496_010630 [Pomphorhynchus laevis]|nr:hypothetical protein GJ496_010630 [Pomphorhynchus laevis]